MTAAPPLSDADDGFELEVPPDPDVRIGSPIEDAGAIEVLRRGVAVSPELRVGFRITVAMALLAAAGRLVIPILIQQILDRGVSADEGFRPEFVYPACGVALAVIIGVFAASRVTYNRLVETSESVLRHLRVRVFGHIHRLSVADHNETQRGALTARVTSDIEQLSRFAQWGAISWIVNSAVILGTLVVMLLYSWQLTLLTIAVYVPLTPVLRWMQRRQLIAYDRVRTRVGDTLSATSEAVMGAGVVRAYGYVEPTRDRLHRAVRRQYRSQVRAHVYFAIVLPIVDVFGAIALCSVVGVGVWWGPGWGLTSGSLVAFLFLVTLVLNPIAEVGEVLDQTQTALAGWRKVLAVLDQPIEIVEPVPGVDISGGPVDVVVDGVDFAYREGGRVLHDVSVSIPSGTAVAVVGETGSGKTTLAKLLVRLADPGAGSIAVGGVDLREATVDSRHRAIRMVPQDGFLFDGSILDNVRMGRDGASDADVAAAFSSLGLDWWLDAQPAHLATGVGERGEELSVGERQLVALARAQLADPGLLILDEATSAVDPETELALGEALERLARGRTTVTIAHRLSTAEAADLVLVFDDGRIVERGPHDDLVAAGGTYALLYESWLGNTQESVRG